MSESPVMSETPVSPADLPNRRFMETTATSFGEGNANGYCVSFGRFDDGAPSEIFISANKASSDAESIARDAAIILSKALQYGAPIADIKSAVTRDATGRAASIIGHAVDLVVAAADAGEEGKEP